MKNWVQISACGNLVPFEAQFARLYNDLIKEMWGVNEIMRWININSPGRHLE